MKSGYVDNMNMENIKHNRQPITEEMLEEFKNTYRLPTKEEEVEILTQLCEEYSGRREFHLEPAAEMTEETKCLLEDFKEKIKCKPFVTSEPIDITLKLETFEEDVK